MGAQDILEQDATGPLIYLAFADDDEDRGERVARLLEWMGGRVIRVEHCGDPDDGFVADVEEALADADLCLMLWSARCEGSEWIAREGEAATAQISLLHTSLRLVVGRLDTAPVPRWAAASRTIELTDPASDVETLGWLRNVGLALENVPTTRSRVAIAYLHASDDSNARVLQLADALRGEGIDCRIDRHVPWPIGGWRLWAWQELRSADHVLVWWDPSFERYFAGAELGLRVVPEDPSGSALEAAALVRDFLESPATGKRRVTVVTDGDTELSGLAPCLKHRPLLRVPDQMSMLLTALKSDGWEGLGADEPWPALPNLDVIGRGWFGGDGPELPDDEGLEEQIGELMHMRDEARRRGGDASAYDQALDALRQAGPSLAEGRLLGDERYLLLRLTGMRAGVQVWQAFDRLDQQRLAVEVLESEDEDTLERFRRGMKLQQRLEAHPGVPGVYETARQDDGLTFSVTELIEGMTLEMTTLGQPFSESQILSCIRELAGALEHAHAKGVVHGDVNPRNVVLDSRGAHYVLTGFEHARQAGDPVTRQRSDGASIYTAPELFDDGAPASPAADVYSLAVTTLFLVLGRHPTADDFPPDALARAPFPNGVMRRVILRAVSNDASGRPATPLALANELGERAIPSPRPTPLATREPVADRPPPLETEIDSYEVPQRSSFGLIAAAALVAVIIGAVWAYSGPSGSAGEGETAEAAVEVTSKPAPAPAPRPKVTPKPAPVTPKPAVAAAAPAADPATDEAVAPAAAAAPRELPTVDELLPAIEDTPADAPFAERFRTVSGSSAYAAAAQADKDAKKAHSASTDAQKKIAAADKALKEADKAMRSGGSAGSSSGALNAADAKLDSASAALKKIDSQLVGAKRQRSQATRAVAAGTGSQQAVDAANKQIKALEAKRKEAAAKSTAARKAWEKARAVHQKSKATTAGAARDLETAVARLAAAKSKAKRSGAALEKARAARKAALGALEVDLARMRNARESLAEALAAHGEGRHAEAVEGYEAALDTVDDLMGSDSEASVAIGKLRDAAEAGELPAAE